MNAVESTETKTIAAEIPSLLDEIDAVPEKHRLTLGDESALYREPVEAWTRPASDFTDPEEVAQHIGSPTYMVNYAEFYDLEGREVPKSTRTPEWWAEQTATTPTTRFHFEHNAAHRLGTDYLMVGHGQYLVAAETTLDGVRAFETISAREAAKRERDKLAVHMPIVLAAKPVWADEPTLSSIDDDSEPGRLGVFYFRTGFLPCEFNESVQIEIAQYARLDTTTGRVLEADAPTPSVYIPDVRSVDDAALTVEELREIGDGIRAMADVLESIQSVN